jgi:hypothetical protein
LSTRSEFCFLSFFLSFSFFFCFSLIAAPAGAVLRVDGAGSAECNGYYRENGKAYGKPQYLKVCL